jgi:chloramphenicol O-acetyltransferase type A
MPSFWLAGATRETSKYGVFHLEVNHNSCCATLFKQCTRVQLEGKMRTIDMQTWSRRQHFNLYNSFNHPHFNMCANVDLTHFLPYLKKNPLSFNAAVVYLISLTANAIPEFRYRIHGEVVIEHEIVHPSTTILISEDVFSFCACTYMEDFHDFLVGYVEKVAYLKEHPTLEEESADDDVLIMTAIPWISFTSFMHPINMHPCDSIPRFAWGKYYKEGERIRMPLSVQAHHAVMDGIHMAKFYEKIQGYLDDAHKILMR